MAGWIVSFSTGCAAAFLLKLTTSIDDLVWFSPFLTFCKTDGEKFKCGAIYLIVCMYCTIAAYGIAKGSEYGLDTVLHNFIPGYDGSGYWNSSRILSCASSLFIGGFALKEYAEWSEDENNDFSFCCDKSNENLNDNNDDGTEYEKGNALGIDLEIEANGKKNPGNEATPLVGSASSDNSLFSKDSRRLFIVAFFGSLDDTVVFAAVLMGKGLFWSELIVGSIVASSLIFFMCVQIASYKPFSDFMSTIPIWTLFTVLSLYILIQGVLLPGY